MAGVLCENTNKSRQLSGFGNAQHPKYCPNNSQPDIEMGRLALLLLAYLVVVVLFHPFLSCFFVPWVSVSPPHSPFVSHHHQLVFHKIFPCSLSHSLTPNNQRKIISLNACESTSQSRNKYSIRFYEPCYKMSTQKLTSRP